MARVKNFMLNAPMNYSPLFVEMPDPLCHLQNDMPCKVFTEVRQLHDLMEKLPALHNCIRPSARHCKIRAATLTFQNQKVMFFALEEVKELHYRWMTDTAHDLHLWVKIRNSSLEP